MNSNIYYSSSTDMSELDDESIQLIVTSPPYYQNKPYGESEQNLENVDSYEEYISMLKDVLSECARVLKPDGKMAINIFDPYTTVDDAGRFKRIPLTQNLIPWVEEELELDYFETIRWKKQRFGSSGTVFGSYPHPTNMYFAGNYEKIVVFRKWVSDEYYNTRELPDKDIKEKSKVTKEEWKEWTDPTWEFDGVDKNSDHPAKFPYELPYRLIRLFTFVGDTVLDPFAGSATTIEAAIRNGRNGIGYEIENKYESIINEKLTEARKDVDN